MSSESPTPVPNSDSRVCPDVSDPPSAVVSSSSCISKEQEPRPTSPSPSSSSSVSSAIKTPVSLLQELYVRRGLTPKYDLVQIEGAIHEPTFKYRVTVGEFVATGCGQSKKKAKHAAAKAVLDKLRAAQKSSAGRAIAMGSTSNGGANNSKALVSAATIDLEIPDLETDLPFADDVEGNPVGELQELCMNRRMQPPIYEGKGHS